MWQNDGLGTCEAVEQGTAEYRCDEDLVGKFLADECALGTTLKIKKDALYKSYKSWAEAKGEYELSKRIFGTRLQDRDEITSDRTGQARVWVGVDLNNHNHVDDAAPEDRKTSPVQMRMES